MVLDIEGIVVGEVGDAVVCKAEAAEGLGVGVECHIIGTRVLMKLYQAGPKL